MRSVHVWSTRSASRGPTRTLTDEPEPAQRLHAVGDKESVEVFAGEAEEVADLVEAHATLPNQTTDSPLT